MNIVSSNNRKTYDMAYIAFFTVLIVVCSWISIPTVVPFTLQTFGVFAAVAILGGKRGTISILIYMLLGLIGIPVFSGFRGGFAGLFGMTGGFIFGFLFSALAMWGIEKLFGKKQKVLICSMIVGLLICYGVGTFWFIQVYGRQTGEIGIGAVLNLCVVPFLIPDVAKISLAYMLAGKIRRYVI